MTFYSQSSLEYFSLKPHMETGFKWFFCGPEISCSYHKGMITECPSSIPSSFSALRG